jgi:hypothetical protein
VHGLPGSTTCLQQAGRLHCSTNASRLPQQAALDGTAKRPFVVPEAHLSGGKNGPDTNTHVGA